MGFLTGLLSLLLIASGGGLGCPAGQRWYEHGGHCLPCGAGRYNHGGMPPLRETCYRVVDREIVYKNATDVVCAPYWHGAPRYDDGEYEHGCVDAIFPSPTSSPRPTTQPTPAPTSPPSTAPTPPPSAAPSSSSPSRAPTASPSVAPSASPTTSPVASGASRTQPPGPTCAPSGTSEGKPWVAGVAGVLVGMIFQCAGARAWRRARAAYNFRRRVPGPGFRNVELSQRADGANTLTNGLRPAST